MTGRCERCSRELNEGNALVCEGCWDAFCDGCLHEHELECGHEAALREFREELETWRNANPSRTEEEQMRVFPPVRLWTRAGGDPTLYAKLMSAAGYVVERFGVQSVTRP